jgi:hypothetical protein
MQRKETKKDRKRARHSPLNRFRLDPFRERRCKLIEAVAKRQKKSNFFESSSLTILQKTI